jgi:hypothetical protein
MTNRYAIIKNGIVSNVVLADAEIASVNGWVECPDASLNWTYADGVFTEPLVVELTAPTTPTKEELLAKLNELQAQIEALE